MGLPCQRLTRNRGDKVPKWVNTSKVQGSICTEFVEAMERGRKSGVGADFVQDATKITATKSETETNAKDDVDEAT